ncbi:hypothetical protein [Acetobacter syzygii]|uniref:hypothetical protein n=1 Tax=Acetobacter syzygii TaxID=146476 RepID=UPI00211BEC2D|nr:hypothetical protein [Acetobacter syzygii]
MLKDNSSRIDGWLKNARDGNAILFERTHLRGRNCRHREGQSAAQDCAAHSSYNCQKRTQWNDLLCPNC